ncbi:MAG: hypothetical protein ACR2FM_01830 [Candidatus Saccharimonadales bacterium]
MNFIAKHTTAAAVIFVLIFISSTLFLFRGQPDKSVEKSNTPSFNNPPILEEPEPDLTSVNPEENHPILSKAGLPHEEDAYAITYRFDDQAPSGVVIVVIDKVNKTVSDKVRSTAINYLKTRSVPVESLTVEYRAR